MHELPTQTPSTAASAGGGTASRRRARRHPRTPFDPVPYERELVSIIDAIEASPELSSRGLDGILRLYPRDGTGFFSRAQVIAGYRAFRARQHWKLDETTFLSRLRLRPVRTLSGVTPVTVLTKPFPCPGKCIFCPSDVRMPKSYLADEPGAQRADANDFDPYSQTWSRLEAYRCIGHPVDKVEMIVLGGTWSFYPEPYQVWFVKRCFDALNDFGRGVDRRGAAQSAAPAFRDVAARVDGRAPADTYNQIVRGVLQSEHAGELLGDAEAADWSALEAAHRENETAVVRSVGFSVETRPDHVTADEVCRIRRLGVTKVQIGIQHLSDAILTANRRGHDVATTRAALRLLRGAGFKIHAHWMPNLLGATPERDTAGFAELFEDADFRPDELKVYPCSLVESAELMGSYLRGEWRPYDEEELVGVLTSALAATPRYCRLTRVIRDFSADDIVAGNKIANLREVAEQRLREAGGVCEDIRAREIRAAKFDPDSLVLEELGYRTSLGREVFLQFVAEGDRLVAFLRLSLPDAANASAPIAELDGSAILREVHVYGASLELGRRDGAAAQHLGLGRRLIERAAEIAAAARYHGLAVISAVGTRGYYRGLGFEDGALYQHRVT